MQERVFIAYVCNITQLQPISTVTSGTHSNCSLLNVSAAISASTTFSWSADDVLISSGVSLIDNTRSNLCNVAREAAIFLSAFFSSRSTLMKP